MTRTDISAVGHRVVKFVCGMLTPVNTLKRLQDIQAGSQVWHLAPMGKRSLTVEQMARYCSGTSPHYRKQPFRNRQVGR